ncbi:type I-E CRISPR-associated protein Cse1/CasA [Corynebacterium mastitidis]|uniref:type I-E CRISPR-associated protein Cse1/CasA n=1 Tax=Corynebacterium mastitidis TaxID=161890 RepID=UPI00254ACF05|nr:type I-E CRISPR-associated protein Cse1/CasA [Corynebacterium mastitidis]MDK8450463.1 type I-E CRISPR-associated protein Cse1/CasA [Corynebacterium mastitidis]
MTRRTFSLLDEPWIACTLRDGSEALLSMRQIFDGEHAVAGLRGDSPAQDYAVLRLLLAAYWRAHRGDDEVTRGEIYVHDEWFETEWDRARENRADTAVLDYLERYRDRFDLLHPVHPFMQVADLHTEKGTRSEVRRIVPEAEAQFFTMRAGQGRETLSFAEAARWLLYTQAYDYSGIKSGAVGDPRVKGGKGYPIGTGWTGMTGGTVLVGSTLRETLVLNTTQTCLIDEASRVDEAAWEREPDGAAQREPTAEAVYPKGPADLATWQSRRVRLFHDGERVTGVLVSNGDRIPDAGANIEGDPMTPYRYSANKSKRELEVYYPRPFDSNRTMWRSLEPLIALESDPGFTDKNKAPRRPETLTQLADLNENLGIAPDWANIQMVSVEYGPQASSVAEVVASGIEIPVALLREDAGAQRRLVLDNAKATLDAAVALGSFAGQLLVAAGGEYEFQAPPTDTLLARLEIPFRQWLRDLDESDIEERARRWQRYVRQRVLADARVLVQGASPQVLVGRTGTVTTEGDKPYVKSAHTAWRALTKRLDEVLPATKRVKEEKR